MERQWLEVFDRSSGKCTLLVCLASVFEHAKKRAQNGTTPLSL